MIGGTIPNKFTNAEMNAKMKLLYFKPFRVGTELREPGQTWLAALADFKQSLEAATVQHPDEDPKKAAEKRLRKEKILGFMKNCDAMHEGECQRDKERSERRAEDERAKLLGKAFARQGVENYDGSADFPEQYYGDEDDEDVDPATRSLSLTEQFLSELPLHGSHMGSDREKNYADAAVLIAKATGVSSARSAFASADSRIVSVDGNEGCTVRLADVDQKHGGDEPREISTVDRDQLRKWTAQIKAMKNQVKAPAIKVCLDGSWCRNCWRWVERVRPL